MEIETQGMKNDNQKTFIYYKKEWQNLIDKRDKQNTLASYNI